MKKKHSLKLVIVSLAFLCWLIPILLMVAVMGYYVLSKQDDEQLERLAEQMAASSRICQERLDGAIANSRRISYDKTVQQKYEQYQRGELSYAALYSEVQYYLSVEYSRKKEAAFALIMMNGKEKDESFNVVNSSAGGSYQGILEFWEQDAELVKEGAAKLDTAIGFVQNQGRLKYQFDHIYEEELALKDAIARLDERQRNILALRFCQGKTQMEVSSEIGISQAQVSRLEKGAIGEIKKNL